MLLISSSSDASTKVLRRKLYEHMAHWRDRLLLLFAEFYFILAMNCDSCSLSLGLLFPRLKWEGFHDAIARFSHEQ